MEEFVDEGWFSWTMLTIDNEGEEMIKSLLLIMFLSLIMLLTTTISFSQNNLPAGSYTQTCRDCSYSNYTLNCRCKPRSSPHIETSLFVKYCAHNTIENLDGHLRCKAECASGSYFQTCRNCSCGTDSMSCECEKKNHHFKQTSISLRNCNGAISNCDGNLKCGNC